MTARTRHIVSATLAAAIVIGWRLATATPAPAAPAAPAAATSSTATSTDLLAVSRVVDGDTLVVSRGGKDEKVRLIGVDTPESVDPRKPVQCFGAEASRYAKSLLEGRSVRLEADASQGERDRYGRLLAYVFLEDGTNVNLELVRQGYAHEYTYRLPYRYQAEFKAAEREAREAARGLWAPETCAGDTSKPAA